MQLLDKIMKQFFLQVQPCVFRVIALFHVVHPQELGRPRSLYTMPLVSFHVLDSDAETAKTLTLVALILQAVIFVLGLFILLFFLVVFIGTTTTSSSGGTVTTVTTSAPVFLGAFGGVLAIIFSGGLLWLLLDYFLVYRKLAEERVKEAETPSLVLGILQLLFGGIIPGILLIIAYVKIKDSASNRRGPAQVFVQPPPN
jgi:hypothetical protein